MKSKVLATLSVALLAGIAWAQTSAQSPATGAAQQPGSTEVETNSSPSQNTASTGEASASNQVAPGLLIPAELSKSVDAKKAKTGDPVVAKITQDMLANGRVVIPHNSKIIGHVTEARSREKGEAESSLGIAFDKIVVKDGRELPLNASIQAIAAPQNNAGVNNEPITGQPAGVPGGGGPGRSGGAMGGEGRTAGNVGGAAPNSGTIGGTSGSSAGGAPQAAPNARLNSNSQGVIGFPGFSLNTAADASQGSVISSQNKNVKLDGGTELMLRTR